MKEDKKSIIGLACVVLSCILVMGITLGLLSSANNTASAGSTTDTTDTTSDNTSETPEEPPVEEPAPEPELQWGYKFEKISGATSCSTPLSNYAYKSQKRTLNIDEAKITISFGARDGNAYIENCSIPEYSIYFASSDDLLIYEGYYLDHSIYTVKTVNEQIFSEEYKVTRVDDRDEIYYYYEFAHSEEITIPKELFTDSKGNITLCIAGKNISGDSHYVENFIIGAISLKYHINGTNEVVLSHEWE